MTNYVRLKILRTGIVASILMTDGASTNNQKLSKGRGFDLGNASHH